MGNADVRTARPSHRQRLSQRVSPERWDEWRRAVTAVANLKLFQSVGSIALSRTSRAHVPTGNVDERGEDGSGDES